MSLRVPICILLLAAASLLPVPSGAALLQIFDAGLPPMLQYNMLNTPGSDITNFSLGLYFPSCATELCPECPSPPCPQRIVHEYPKCSDGGNSHINVYIDGTIYEGRRGTSASFLRHYLETGYPQLIPGGFYADTIVTQYFVTDSGRNIEIIEKNWIDFITRGGHPYPTVYFNFRIINGDDAPHEVGVLLNFDIFLGQGIWCACAMTGADNPPVQVSGEPSLITTRRAYGVAPSFRPIPAMFQSYQIGPTVSSDSQVVIIGDLSGPGLTTPTFFAIGQGWDLIPMPWYDGWSPAWEGLPITDADIAWAYGPDMLAPSDEITYTTRLGLGPSGSDTLSGRIAIEPISLPEMYIEHCRTLPDPLTYDFQLQNTDDTRIADSVWARFEILARSSCFSFDPATPALHSPLPSELFPLAYGPISWHVIFHPDDPLCILPGSTE